MTRVSDIIKNARDSLAEQTPKRWSSERLLRALTEGQTKIAQELLSITEKGTIDMCAGHHTYKLDTTNILTGGRAVAISAIRNHADKACRFVTTTIMDEIDADWRTAIGADITHIIYNKQKPLIFRVYPIPTTSKLKLPDVFNTTDNPITAAATVCRPIATLSNFNIAAEIAPIKMLVEFYHVPPPIIDFTDTNLLIPNVFDIALKHYVVGITIRDDMDKQNRSFGIEELRLFDSQYQAANDLLKDNFVDQKEEHYASVKYNAEIK